MPLTRESLEKVTAVVKGPECDVRKLLKQLSPEEQQLVRETLEDTKVPGSVLAKWLRSEGYHLSPYTIQRHRRGECNRCQDD